jgi:hypothetical protein
MELLEYGRREAAAAAGDDQGARSWQQPWAPPSEKDAESQFAMTQMLVPMGMVGRENRIPEHLRDAIRWAEEQKEKRGLN